MSFPVWRELKRFFFKHFYPPSTISLQCPFPFEGNWNLNSSSFVSFFSAALQCPFPFEGNWNFFLSSKTRADNVLQCPFPFEGNWNWNASVFAKHRFDLQCPFPFEGNWNWRHQYVSRVDMSVLQCPFPFEGNWNVNFKCRLGLWRYPLTMSFPVWRELKQVLNKRDITRAKVLQCPFPFEGNWNPLRSIHECLLTTYNVLSRLKGIETPLVARFHIKP